MKKFSKHINEAMPSHTFKHKIKPSKYKITDYGTCIEKNGTRICVCESSQDAQLILEALEFFENSKKITKNNEN